MADAPDGVSAFGSSVVNVTGGTLQSWIYSYDDTVVSAVNGSGSGFVADNQSSVEVLGGSWGSEDCTGCAEFKVSGGYIWTVSVADVSFEFSRLGIISAGFQ